MRRDMPSVDFPRIVELSHIYFRHMIFFLSLRVGVVPRELRFGIHLRFIVAAVVLYGDRWGGFLHLNLSVEVTKQLNRIACRRTLELSCTHKNYELNGAVSFVQATISNSTNNIASLNKHTNE